MKDDKEKVMGIRVNRERERQFEEICREFGITKSAAVNLFMYQVISTKEIHFNLKAIENNRNETEQE